ncbi:MULTISPECIES: hypothetical protein [Spirulina sp. CCY15215]|uniref:hypothetical protein n=1 Tax=Spirulina sp. CCY15215 TaxID=2767591 RepID=UPI00194FE20A|nr:hypothetical protein [Spirulina major]
MMTFEEIWQKYDFTESELLSMGWQLPNDYVLNLNYYWELNPKNEIDEIATEDQPLKLILSSCIHLDVQFNPEINNSNSISPNLGTIVGWGRINSSSWLQNLSFSPDNWLHLFFDLGGENRIEILARSLSIQPSPILLAS